MFGFAVASDRSRLQKEVPMNERLGVALAILSSFLGGSAAAVTRYLVGSADPITLAILRWGIGFLIVLPVALMLGVRWPCQTLLERGRHFGAPELSDC